MERIVPKRNSLKNKMAVLCPKDGEQISPAEAAVRIEQLEKYYTDFNSAQDEIENALFEDDTLPNQEAIGLEGIQLYVQIKGKLKSIIQPDVNVVNQPPRHNKTNKNVNLPELNIPNFQGDLKDWLSFKDLFTSIIINDADLSGAEKLVYLKTFTKGKAHDEIKNIDITNENFTLAWGALETKFANKRRLVYSHLKTLIDLESAKTDLEVRNLNDTVNQTLQALQNIEQPENGNLLVYLIRSKLPTRVIRDWERSLKSNNRLPKIEELSDFIKSHIQVLDEVTEPPSKPANSNAPLTTKSIEKPKPNQNQTREIVCSCCKGSHMITSCPKFLSQDIDQRWSTVASLQVCRNCLKGKHQTTECKSTVRCSKCTKPHNVLLHKDFANSKPITKTVAVTQAPSAELSTPGTSVAVIAVNQVLNQQSVQNLADSTNMSNANDIPVLLPTVMAKIKTNNGSYIQVRVYLDSCSQIDLVSEKIARLCEAPIVPAHVNLAGVGNANETSNYKTSFTMYSLDGNYQVEIESAQILPQVVKNPPHIPEKLINEIKSRHIQLADSKLHTSEPIEVLIGARYFNSIIQDGFMDGLSNGMTLRNTKFGWTVFGGAPQPIINTPNNICCFTLNTQLEKFWRQEEVLPTYNENWSMEEKFCEELFSKTTKIINGRFHVKLPFKCDITTDPNLTLNYTKTKLELLGTNIKKAMNQLLSIERKLTSNPELKQKYINFMNEYENLKHMQATNESPGYGYFIPHHAVFKRNSENIRVVFNASAISSMISCLNKLLCTGPSLQVDLFLLFLSFRKYLIGLLADIEKMYRQVMVAEEDRVFQQILWRPDPLLPIIVYLLNTLTYGTSPASFLAVRCLEEIAKLIEKTRPKLAYQIRKRFFMDDFTSGEDNLEAAKKLKNDMISVLKEFGFNLRNWRSNIAELNDEIESVTNVLGLLWYTETDNLAFQMPNLDSTIPNTKRKCLSEISRLFDPLGLISPIIITAKLFLQMLWSLNVDWDEKLPQNILENYENFREMLKQLPEITIPRYVGFKQSSVMELHVFADASEKALAAVVYLRTIGSNDTTTCSIVASKTRLAPTEKVTLPRLELCAATLAAQLIHRVADHYEIPLQNCYGWSDSTITLSWLSSHPNRWKEYVANRVSTIQGLLPATRWRHIPGKINPADYASRGKTIHFLKTSQLWWTGPAFLCKPNFDSFKSSITQFDENANEEQKPLKTRTLVTIEKEQLLPKISTFLPFVKRVAYLTRFIHNIKQKKAGLPRQTGPLTVLDHKTAIIACVKATQLIYWREKQCLLNNKKIPKQSTIKRLCPIIDTDGVLRVGGRLANAEWSYNKKHPIILPSKDRFTEMLIMFEHRSNLHAPPETLNAKLRFNYWIIHSRSTIKEIIRKCLDCAKANPVSKNQLMGNLPEVRLTPGRPFSHVGVDYAGPLMLKTSKLRKAPMIPAYIALFICMKTKAVHIELVLSLSADEFIATLRRFIARRGYPTEFFSDNGTNFVASNHILIKKLGEFLQFDEVKNQISSYLTPKQITWNFIPPRSPHFGGLWESNIKSLKLQMRKVIGEVKLTQGEMETLLVQIEGMLNSRPLTTVSDDPNDLECITPGHFLTGSGLLNLPEKLSDEEKTPRNRWHLVQQFFIQIWKRWQMEYVATLQQRQKWTDAKKNIKVGDLVLISNPTNMPGHWSIGRIITTYPGNDDVVRVVDIKTNSGIYKRAVNKIVILP